MIVDTMTYDDIYSLFQKDKNGIIIHKMEYANELGRKYNIKTNSKTIQFYKPIKFESGTTGLKYIIQIVNFGLNIPKKQRIGISLYAFFVKNRGIYVATEVDDCDGGSFDIYTPHFFDRYRERFLGDSTISKEDTIMMFIHNNLNNMRTDIESKKHPDNWYNVCNDGLCLCTKHPNNIYEMNTFVTFEMLHEDQADVVKEANDAIKYFKKNFSPTEVVPAIYVNTVTKEVFFDIK